MMRDFTAVPNSLLRGEVRHPDGRRVGDGALALYLLILSYSRGDKGACTAAQSTLAGKLDVTVRQLRKRLRELEQLELVKCERGGRNGTNTVTPLCLPERKLSSATERNDTSDKEDAQGEEDNDITKGDAVVVALRWDRAS
jgi:Helix-turn-helix domain